jgi:hypothetical protein
MVEPTQDKNQSIKPELNDKMAFIPAGFTMSKIDRWSDILRGQD